MNPHREAASFKQCLGVRIYSTFPHLTKTTACRSRKTATFNINLKLNIWYTVITLKMHQGMIFSGNSLVQTGIASSKNNSPDCEVVPWTVAANQNLAKEIQQVHLRIPVS